jgi:hypothetical protein
VYSLRETIADPGDGRERICSHSKMGHFSQVLKRVPLGGNWIRVWILDPTNRLNLCSLHLDRLPLALRLGNRASADHRATARQPLHVFCIVGEIPRGHDLHCIKAGPIVDLQKGKAGLRIAASSNPTTHFDQVTHPTSSAGEQALDSHYGRR